MGAFDELIRQHNISHHTVLRISGDLEARTEQDEALSAQRRQTVAGGKTLKEAGLAKPKLGRGVSEKQWADAMAGRPVSRRGRAKLFRAVNAILAKKGAGEVTYRQLFGTVKTKPGPKRGARKAAKK